MKDKCDKCDQTYMPAPGFYYGSMFISYGLVAWFCIGFVILLHWVWDWGLEVSFGMLIVILAILYAWIFRFSRSLWLSLNVKYKPEVLANKQTEKQSQ